MFAAIHKQQLPLLHYSGISKLPDFASVAQTQFLHSCCVHVCSWCAGPTDMIIITGACFQLSWNIVCRHSLSLHLNLAHVPLASELWWWGACLSHKNRITPGTSSWYQLSSVVATAHQLVNSMWLTDWLSDCLLHHLLNIIPTRR
jgi:hypothetical protein